MILFLLKNNVKRRKKQACGKLRIGYFWNFSLFFAKKGEIRYNVG